MGWQRVWYFAVTEMGLLAFLSTKSNRQKIKGTRHRKIRRGWFLRRRWCGRWVVTIFAKAMGKANVAVS